MEGSYSETLREWSGPTVPAVFNPKAAVGDVLYYLFQQNQAKTAQILASDGSRLTFGELWLNTAKVALNLRRLGVLQRDVVVVMAFNHAHVASVMFGSIVIGAPLTFLDPSATKSDILRRLELVKRCKVFVCDEFKRSAALEALETYGSEAKVVTFEELSDTLLRDVEGAETFRPDLVLEDSAKEILFISSTSGTTGTPKGSAISHAYFISHSISNFLYVPGVVYFYAPLCWISSVNHIIAHSAAGVTRLVDTCATFDPMKCVQHLQEFKVDVFFAIPGFLVPITDCLDRNKVVLDSIKIMFASGTFLYEETRTKLKKWIPNGAIIDTYAMTETLLMTMGGPNDEYGSAGKISPRLRFKIVDEHGKRLGPGQVGEVCVASEEPNLGYLNAPNEEVFDPDGFFHTGDEGYFDDKGNLFLEGRMKDTIDYRSKTAHASKIEDFVAKTTGLTELCVVPTIDLVTGFEPPAAAIVKPQDSPWTEEAIAKVVQEGLAPHEHLDGGVFFVQQLPRTINGKVKRLEVRDLVKELRKNRL